MRNILLTLLILVLLCGAFLLRQQKPADASDSELVTTLKTAGLSEKKTEPSNLSQTVAPTTSPSTAATSAETDRIFATIPDGPFRESLLKIDRPARERVIKRLIRINAPKEDYSSLRATPEGDLYYVCDFHPPATTQNIAAETAASVTEPTIEAAAVPITNPPVRHSRPGATKTLYLDFNGHTVTGTAWNSTTTTFQALPYDTDGDNTTFSDAEQAVIIQVWERVSEDYSTFDVDVTTEEPAIFTNNTGRALITKNTDANGVAMPSSTAGGVAYTDVFGGSNYATRYSPAFVYYNNIGGGTTASLIAEAVAHELGHNIGLSHDGQTDGTTYYSGHGSGEISWGPIMGTGYNRNVSQWSKGEYYLANNNQDDLAVIGSNLGFVSDATGNTIATATTLPVSNNSFSTTGLLNNSTDFDVYAVTLTSGTTSFSVMGYRAASGTHGGNTDIKLELLDSNGTILITADPSTSAKASFSYTVANGTYFIRLTPTGTGTPTSATPTGYTSYASAGQYTLTGASATTAAPTITTQPSSRTVSAGSSATFSVVATGTPTPTYQWKFAGTAITSATDSTYTIASTTSANAGAYTVTVTNNQGTITSSTANLTITSTIAPSITTQPVSQAVTIGGAATFTVAATGTPTPSFQWRFNGSAISGASNTTYSIASTALSNAGSYSVTATNTAGTITSNTATLTINVVPAITTQPVSQTVTAGTSVTFSAAATGTPTPSFQWKLNGSVISGATNTNFTDSFVTPADAGTYTVTATNSAGSVTSNTATLTVNVIAPAITSPSQTGGAVNVPFTYAITATNAPTSFSAVGLPAGLTLNTSTGTISGTPTASGAFTVTLAATNSAGSAALELSLTVLPSATITTVAGTPGALGSADGASATFNYPSNIVADSTGVLYVTDSSNHTIRKIALSGSVTTFAGLAGTAGSSDGASSLARFNAPAGITIDGDGNLYVADGNNSTLRKITPLGVVTTLAGSAGSPGTTDGIGTNARFNHPAGLVIDASSTLFVADSDNHAIRKITISGTTATVTTLAGLTGTAGSTDGAGTAARFKTPLDLALDAIGNLYVADTGNHTLRKITLSLNSSTVTTVAGQPSVIGTADGTGTSARFKAPAGLAFDRASGRLYLTDSSHTLRQFNPANNLVITLAGLAGTTGTPNGAGSNARFNLPTGLAIDANNYVFIADTDNHTIRAISSAPAITTQPQSQTVPVGTNVALSITAIGQPIPSYQWYKDNVAIAGATSATLTLANAQTTNSGTYSVTATNNMGISTSNSAILTVNIASASSSSTGGGSGGGGGGLPNTWFFAALLAVNLARRLRRKR